MTEATRTPALPTIARPGSSITAQSSAAGWRGARPGGNSRAGGGRIVVGPVGNAQAAAEIDMFDSMSVGPERAYEVGEQRERVIERLKIDDLRADVHIDAADAQARQGPCVGVDVAGARDRDAELVLRLAGRDLGVGAGVDIGIDPDGDRRNGAQAHRRARQKWGSRLSRR